MSTNHSVDRALNLLRILSESTAPMRFTDLQLATGIPKGTLHSLLASLEAAEFVRRGPAGFEIGIAAFAVGTAVRAPASLRSVVSPLLDSLCDRHGEACHFGMLHDGDVVYLDVRDSVHALRFTQRVGARVPAYATALGKAMLAQLRDEEIIAAYPDPLPALTETTLTSRTALLALVQDVRRVGYATESEESTPGVCCIGVAGRQGDVIFGLSYTIPVQRAQVGDLPRYLPALSDTLASLDQALATRRYFGRESESTAGGIAVGW
jgi:IclR family transcriptional regulator, acetate operon repressor